MHRPEREHGSKSYKEQEPILMYRKNQFTDLIWFRYSETEFFAEKTLICRRSIHIKYCPVPWCLVMIWNQIVIYISSNFNMKFYSTIILLLLGLTLNGQVRLKNIERHSSKWQVPVTSYLLPLQSEYSMSYLPISTILDSSGIAYESPLFFTSPLVRVDDTISIQAATGSLNGYLKATDWPAICLCPECSGCFFGLVSWTVAKVIPSLKK